MAARKRDPVKNFTGKRSQRVIGELSCFFPEFFEDIHLRTVMYAKSALKINIYHELQ